MWTYAYRDPSGGKYKLGKECFINMERCEEFAIRKSKENNWEEVYKLQFRNDYEYEELEEEISKWNLFGRWDYENSYLDFTI